MYIIFYSHIRNQKYVKHNVYSVTPLVHIDLYGNSFRHAQAVIDGEIDIADYTLEQRVVVVAVSDLSVVALLVHPTVPVHEPP
mmetsp:Transcript_13493/g.19895  ORF Transcript_13493/g.19895 Transcript_13493/m.19895 type:complete len:83 (-) Transcript_13493:575-823(-)